jgi:hypothetical protein
MPQVAEVGLTEEQCRSQGLRGRAFRFVAHPTYTVGIGQMVIHFNGAIDTLERSSVELSPSQMFLQYHHLLSIKALILLVLFVNRLTYTLLPDADIRVLKPTVHVIS